MSKREELSKDRLSFNYFLFVFDQANDLKRFTNTRRDIKAPNEDKVASINTYLKHMNKFTKYILRKKSSIIILAFNRKACFVLSFIGEIQTRRCPPRTGNKVRCLRTSAFCISAIHCLHSSFFFFFVIINNHNHSQNHNHNKNSE